MDAPITEKQPNALQRVTQALRDGVHQIDSDDVKQIIQELSSSRNMEIKTLLASYAELESRFDVTRLALDASHGISRAFDHLNMQLTTQVRAMKEHEQELQIALDASQGQVKQLESEVAELRDLCDGRSVFKAPDASHGQVNPPDDDFLEEYING